MVNLDQSAWVINAILESQFVIFISPLPSRAASGWSKIIPVQAGFGDEKTQNNERMAMITKVGVV